MKFAKVLQQTLIEEDLPQEWVEAAIQYKVLKKCISRIVKELAFLGLSQADLKLLLQDEELDSSIEVATNEATPNNPIVAHYTLKKANSHIVPYLKIVLNNNESNQYSPDRIQELAGQIRAKLHSVMSTDDEDHHIIELKEDEDLFVLSPTTSIREEDAESIVKVENHNEIVIMLNSDSKFFRMLSLELEKLDEIRTSEEKKLIDEIDALSNTVLLLTRKKSDLYTWREFFRIYLDSEVYFRYNETSQSHLERSSEQIKRNLQDFADRAKKARISERFKSKLAVSAYNSFLQMNTQLLKIILYQSINSTALRKILKKFDKRTCLNVSGRFPDLISKDHVFVHGSSVAQSICFVMQNKLLTLVPQLDDYTCPICMSIAFKPIRLDCGHIFCVRCLVKTKQRGRTDCPLCRYHDAIAIADSSNLDLDAMELIKKNFPREVKEKLKEIDQERYNELVKHKNCVIS
ncbi:hypothetical protein METBIDRAFT_36843 [Metschnikowia bicuspidata var. bicuspidata NRRL YB-4993]|uniref:RING-14 protein n=1 Tax=Metschnikowia bicuspidata var. bicuspidata NRRL YB-4993 TaxID=869754 RepID=A0A1A0HHV5_9ASCO|nr:hypothetical protein METBIDRAFT_36843 [Metschnikowia bicuspidata var. bicuspidata NRRL YB-4993]OBA23462.1 hypothetical protein METBIDRAFT_36843 [Metschnikowia bicuspidata var. bicuspidata NRRL YB-4993]